MQRPRNLEEAVEQGYAHLLNGADVKLVKDGMIFGSICLLKLDAKRVVLDSIVVPFVAKPNFAVV